MKNPQFAEFSKFIFQNCKKYYFTATSATYKNIHPYKSICYKTEQFNLGGKGGVKKSFFSFQKMNFINSAICGIIIFLFLRTKKERFLSTLSTSVKNSTLTISIIKNYEMHFNKL